MLLSVPVSAQGLYAPPSDELHPAPPSVPAYGVFCGDTLWFDTPEKYERMDRELMSFTYMHTTTTLMLKRSGRYFPMIEKALKASKTTICNTKCNSTATTCCIIICNDRQRIWI